MLISHIGTKSTGVGEVIFGSKTVTLDPKLLF